MLFSSKQFNSIYDFENNVPEGDRNLKKLAESIVYIVEQIADAQSQGEEIILEHADNNAKKIILPLLSEKVTQWTTGEIEIVLYRKTGEKTCIAQQLLSWGVKKEDNANFSEEYVKLLYFFFMVQYVVFPNQNIFNLLSLKNISTDFSLTSNSDRGKYLFFIKENLFDIKSVAEKIIYEDEAITKAIYKLSLYLDNCINPNNYDSKNIIDKIDEFIAKVFVDCADQDDTSHNPIDIVADYIYSYQNKAYINEMLKNMTTDDDIFKFPEMENEIDNLWKSDYVKIEDIGECLMNPCVKAFYMQAHTNQPKYLEYFIENILLFDARCFESNKSAFWLQARNNDIVVTKYDLALMAKTFMDLSTTKYAIRMKKDNKNWNSTISFRKALTADAMQDMAGRYFIIAFESERINAEWGPGSYFVLFKPFILKKYIVIQRVMKTAFEIENINQRSVFIQRLLEALIM